MELLPLAFASGWASGLNAYAAVLLLGLLGRFAHTGGAAYPVAATVIAGIIMVVGFVLLWFAVSRIEKGWLALRRWMARTPVPEAA